jgi:Tfp pilus assembly protein PilO
MMRRFVPLLAPVLVALVVWAAVVMTTGSTAAADRRVAGATEAIGLLADELDAAEALDDTTAAQLDEDRIRRAAVAVPVTADLAPLLVVVDRLAAANGVVVEQLVPTIAGANDDDTDVDQRPATTSMISIALSGRGSYEAVIAFLEELTGGDRLAVVSRLELATVDQLDTLRFDATVEVFTTAVLGDVAEAAEQFDANALPEGAVE